MKKHYKEMLAILIFLVITVITITVLTNITMPKRYDYGSTWKSYLKEPKHSVDVMFFGSSLVYCNVVPSVIYENSGVTSYVMAGPEQTIPISYYYIKQSVKTQTPKAIFLEASAMFFEKYQNFTKVNLGYMPFSANKLEAIFKTAESDEIPGLLFPLYNYHTRWSSLTLGDLKTGIFGYEKDIYAGYTYLDKIEPQTEPWPKGELFDASTYKENLDYLKKIADFCKKKDITLIFYVSPSFSTLNPENLALLKKDVSGIKNLIFIDLNEKIDDMNIDMRTDFFDLMHFNCLGAEKFSVYLANLIASFGIKAADNEDMSLWWSRIANFKKQKSGMIQDMRISLDTETEPSFVPNNPDITDPADKDKLVYDKFVSLVKAKIYDEAVSIYESSGFLKEGYEKAGLYYAYAKAIMYHEKEGNFEAVKKLKDHINSDFILTLQYKQAEPYKRTSYGATWGSYLNEPKDSIDVMFFGSSLIYCDIAPSVIYSKSKITSYVMGGPEQTIPITYYYIKEALKTQNPKLVFVEVTGMFYDRYYSSTDVNIQFMPKGINRLSATLEAVNPKSWESLLFSVYDYKDNQETDLLPYLSYTTDIHAGYTYLSDIEKQNDWVYRPIVFNEQEYLRNLEYLFSISSLCKEKEIELVFFIAPSFSRIEPYYLDKLSSDISELGYGSFADHNILYTEENIDKSTHFFDILHFNCYGAAKYSEFLSGILVNEYGLSATENENTALWQSRADNFTYMLMQ
ncbi:MAG: hypothetical protein BWX97_00427 [Firmicutes bacterium ADurb.Bin146]|nr:MAG: hypothetical protein BWX97_00427 [Firmicutes bacterium ADurb.Bin146]